MRHRRHRRRLVVARHLSIYPGTRSTHSVRETRVGTDSRDGKRLSQERAVHESRHGELKACACGREVRRAEVAESVQSLAVAAERSPTPVEREPRMIEPDER